MRAFTSGLTSKNITHPGMNRVVKQISHRVILCIFKVENVVVRSYPSGAVPNEEDLLKCSDAKIDGESLVEESVKFTEKVRYLVRENNDLKEKLHQLAQKSHDSASEIG